MRFFLAGMLLLIFPLSAHTLSQDRYLLQNEYIRLSGADGRFDTFQADPSGNSAYGPNWIKSLQIGDGANLKSNNLRWTLEGSVLKLSGVSYRIATERVLGKGNTPHRLLPGKSIGQRFRVDWDALTRVTGYYPTWHTDNAAFTMTLRRDGPQGSIIAQKRFRNVSDNSEKSLEFNPQPPGVYFVEISDAEGTPGWWGADRSISEEETGFIDGKPAPVSMHVRLNGYNPGNADWELSLDGNRLRWKTSASPVWIVTPWIKSGYVTEDPKRIVFSRFISDSGIYRPVHQFKRKTSQSLAARWIEMTGTPGFNLRFNFPQATGITWNMTEDTMLYRLDLAENELEVLPFTEKLPDMFPAFFSSNPAMDRVLNQFLYSHGFNFGIGCYPDWKEWQTRILCWSKNPQVAPQASFLKSYQMRPDGYVHSWGDSEGWPFPYKDEDKDGKNDLDTRHFTTNPCYILGCANHALWSRDREFLAAVLPRVRKAMEYQLKQLQGEKGIIITDAEGHTGKADAIGSNYWDILPFGYKDAFSNSYYYASLEAMAKIEEMANQLKLPGESRSPEFYRELRKKVREDYQRNFWDDTVGRFVGCVDVDGIRHDYGFTFVNLEAMAYGLADIGQVERIYHWMETEPTSSGKADTYSRWIFAPRSATFHNPCRHEPQTPRRSWWHSGWGGTDFDGQCQAGGAILYTSYYDIVARARYLGADNAFARFKAMLDRYSMPDHLSGGNPLYLGERTQGGGEGAGSVGVEGEFPESGLAPASFLYAFLGIEPDVEGLKIRPNLPSSLDFAGVRHLSYGGRTYEVRVTNNSVYVRCTDPGSAFAVRKTLKPGEVFVLDRYFE